MKRSKTTLTLFILTSAASLLMSCENSSSSDASSDPGSSDAWNKRDYGIPWNHTSITYGTITDPRDNQLYRTVVIGTQTWMAENLNYLVDSSWWYKGNADSGAKYGRVYHWASAMQLPDSCNNSSCATQLQSKHQGACPSGWHVPKDAEWSTLASYLGSDSMLGAKLKSTTGWSRGNGTDRYGFRAIPGGYRHNGSSFYFVASHAYFWTSSEHDTTHATTHDLASYFDSLGRSSGAKRNAFSVRCLKD